MTLLHMPDEVFLFGVGQGADGAHEVAADLAVGAGHVTAQVLALLGLEVAELAPEILGGPVDPPDVVAQVRVPAERLLALRARFVFQLQMDGLRLFRRNQQNK